jgi:hypothetical protein
MLRETKKKRNLLKLQLEHTKSIGFHLILILLMLLNSGQLELLKTKELLETSLKASSIAWFLTPLVLTSVRSISTFVRVNSLLKMKRHSEKFSK